MAIVTIVTFSTVNNLGVAGTSTIVPKPSGTVDGDLLVVTVGNRTGGTTTVATVPTGWTLIKTETGATNKILATYWKTASSEPASWTWTWTSSGLNAGSALRINSNDPVTTVDVNNSAATANGVTSLVFTDTVTPTKTNQLLLFPIFASRAATGLTSISGYAVTNSNPTWTSLYDLNDNSALSMEFTLAYATFTVASATGNSTATVNGAAAGEGAAGMLIAINRQTTFTSTISDTQTTTDTIISSRVRPVTVSDTQTTTDTILVAFGSRWTKLIKSISTWIDDTRHQ